MGLSWFRTDEGLFDWAAPSVKNEKKKKLFEGRRKKKKIAGQKKLECHLSSWKKTFNWNRKQRNRSIYRLDADVGNFLIRSMRQSQIQRSEKFYILRLTALFVWGRALLDNYFTVWFVLLQVSYHRFLRVALNWISFFNYKSFAFSSNDNVSPQPASPRQRTWLTRPNPRPQIVGTLHWVPVQQSNDNVSP